MIAHEARTLGWPGPSRADGEPVGWQGVSRETSSLRRSEPDTEPAAPPVTETAPIAEVSPAPEPSAETVLDAAAPTVPGAPLAAEPAATADIDKPGNHSALPEPTADDLPTPDALARAPEAATVGVPTAADLAGDRPDYADPALPLSTATEHSRAVAEGRPVRRSIPAPTECRVMVVANQKGGVGKTTTAVNVAAALAQHGLRVLLIDLDPQGNASTALAVPHSEGTPGTYQVLVESVPIAEVVVPCPDIDGLTVVPASIDLAGAEIELVSLVARETRLKKALTAYLAEETAAGRGYDYVFIDCPPSLGLLTVNALSAGREMLIPIQCEYYALEGLSALLRTLDQIREHLNPELGLGAIILTMFDGRTRLAAGVADEVRRHFGDQVLETAIPRSVRISEAPSYGQTVLTYDPGSPGALSYLDAASELAHQVEVSR